MSFQGVEFTPEMRKMVVNVKHFFDNVKKTQNAMERPASQLAASALDISESTIKVIMATFNKKGEDGLNFSKFQQRLTLAFRILEKRTTGIYTPFVRYLLLQSMMSPSRLLS